jgi:hypothetical protein
MSDNTSKRSLATSRGTVFCDLRSGWIKIPPYRRFDEFQKWKGASEIERKQKARDDFFMSLETLFALRPHTLTDRIKLTRPSIPIACPVSEFFIPPSPLAQVYDLVDSRVLATSISGLIASKPNSPHAAALVSLLFGHLIRSPLDNCFEVCTKKPEISAGVSVVVPVPQVYAFFVDHLAVANREDFVKSLIVRASSCERRIAIVRDILDLTLDDNLDTFDRATRNRILDLSSNLFWTDEKSPPHPDFVPMVHQAQIVSAINPRL